MNVSLILVTKPAVEVVTVEEAKLHLRVDGDDEDKLIERIIEAARLDVENFLWHALITQTWKLTVDYFPADAILLKRSPVNSVNSITYLDLTGKKQTLDPVNYTVDNLSTPARIVRKGSSPTIRQYWPVTSYYQLNVVSVEFVAGYGDKGKDVPADIVEALLVRVGDLYRHRESNTMGRAVSPVEGSTWKHLIWPRRWHL